MHMMMVCFVVCFVNMSSSSVRFRRVVMDTLRQHRADRHIAAQFARKAPLVKSTLTRTSAIVILNRT